MHLKIGAVFFITVATLPFSKFFLNFVQSALVMLCADGTIHTCVPCDLPRKYQRNIKTFILL